MFTPCVNLFLNRTHTDLSLSLSLSLCVSGVSTSPPPLGTHTHTCVCDMTLYSKYSPKWHGNNSLFSSLDTLVNFVQYLTVGTKLTQHQNVRDQIDTLKGLEAKLTQYQKV